MKFKGEWCGLDLTIDDELWGPEPSNRPEPVRLAFAAARVVMKGDYRRVEHSLERPGSAAEIAECIDWPATRAGRRWLASHGFAIAEAMDTAQRFMLGWPSAERLIQDCASLGAPFVAGASTDHVKEVGSPDELAEAVAYQCGVVSRAGGVPVILPMPQLTAWGTDADGYVRTYLDIVRRHDGPVILHWLGPMFLASLDGYFPGDSFERIMAAEPERIRGAKLSMLDAELERRLRRTMLERGQIMLTGDDFNFAELIEGDGPVTGTTMVGAQEAPIGEFSHALLGIFDAIAAPAGRALRDLARGDVASYRRIMSACERLSRTIFEAPTTHYKAGLAFLAWHAGRQDNWMLVNHEEKARSGAHLQLVMQLAGEAGVFESAEAVIARLDQSESKLTGDDFPFAIE